ncbi:GMC oxidoreductase, partial [Acinetobacter baumannii]
MSTEEDRQFFVNAMRRLRQIFKADPISSEISEEYLPGPSVRSDEELLGYVRATGSTCFHPCGSCRMGGDADSVVD